MLIKEINELDRELTQKGVINFNGYIIRKNYATSFTNEFTPHWEYFLEKEMQNKDCKYYTNIVEILKSIEAI